MLEIKLHIINELGLHAKCSGMIARVAVKAKKRVWLVTKNGTADAKSLLDVLSLGAGRGKSVTIRLEDPADEAVLRQLVRLFEEGFGEKASDGC